MERHADVQNEDANQAAFGQLHDISTAGKYRSNQTYFPAMLLEFQHMWYRCLERVNTAKRRTKLLKP